MRSGGNTSAMSTAIAPTPRAGLSVSVTLLDAMALRAAVALVALVAVALLGCGGATAPLVGAPAPADGGAAPDSPSPPSSPCGYAVDITAGGTFHGDTCEGKSASIPHCSPNARVALFEVSPEPESSNRMFYVTDGFTLGAMSGQTCVLDSSFCDAGGIGGVGLSEELAWYLAVWRADGGCGPFTLDVYNAASCGERANPASCLCGGLPACAVGQYCSFSSPPELKGRCLEH